MRQRPARILPAIVASQFAGTSLWFAGNAVLPDLQREWGLAPEALGYVTSAVQLGFISGTLVFAFLAIADRVSPRLVFLLCSLAGAAANLGVLASDGGLQRCSPAALPPGSSSPASTRSALRSRPAGTARGSGMRSACWSARWCSAPRFPTF
jgi:hypothetical protein